MKPKYINIIVFSVCIICFILSLIFDIKYSMGFKDGCELYCYITYIFFHTNIIHLGINLYAFYLFCVTLGIMQNFKQNIIMSFAYAIICAVIINSIFTLSKPTIGLSGVIYAMLGSLLVETKYNKSLLKAMILVVLINVLSCIFGSSNILIHFSCLLSPIIISLIKNSYGKYSKHTIR